VPLAATVCGLPEALSVKMKLPDWAPTLVGVKVTVTVQLVLGASAAGQPLTAVKGPVVVTL
jgi:hypothetical protein